MLSIIATENETYGYVITQRLNDAGLGRLKGSTIYPLLARLENDGDLSATWKEGDGGPGRKYYSVTTTGAERLEDLRSRWSEFAARSTALITGKKESL